MILVHKNKDNSNTMTITLNGSAEEVAQEYVAITLKLHDEFPEVLDRANWYLEDIIKIRKEVSND